MPKQIIITKGGPGSGHHDHAGIPGHQGGSAPSNSTIVDFENKHFGDGNHEWGMVLDKDGNVLLMGEGTQTSFTVPFMVLAKSDGGTLTHSHIMWYPFSLEDVALAIHANLAEVRAVCKDDKGNKVTYSMRPRPGTKWPPPESFKWNVNGTIDEMKIFNRGLVGREYWDSFWTQLAKRMDMVYEVHSGH